MDQSTNLPSRAVLWKLNCVSCGHDAARFEKKEEGSEPLRGASANCARGDRALQSWLYNAFPPRFRALHADRGREALRRLGDAHVAEPLPLRTSAAFPGGTARGGLREAPDTPEGSCVCGLRAAVQAKFLNFVALDASPSLPLPFNFEIMQRLAQLVTPVAVAAAAETMDGRRRTAKLSNCYTAKCYELGSND